MASEERGVSDILNLRRLRGIRVEKDLTQEDMAKKLNISLSSYQNKENGHTKFTLDEALKISEMVKLKIEDIFEFGKLNEK